VKVQAGIGLLAEVNIGVAFIIPIKDVIAWFEAFD
jgi:hypothetical protein